MDPRHFADATGLSQTLRVPMSKVDSLLRQAEEFIPIKATAVQRIMELREIGASLVSWEKEWTRVRPQARAIPKSLNERHRSNEESLSSNGQAATPSRMAKVLAFLDRNESTLRSVEIEPMTPRNLLAGITARKPRRTSEGAFKPLTVK